VRSGNRPGSASVILSAMLPKHFSICAFVAALAILVVGCSSSGGLKQSSPVTAMQPPVTTSCTVADLHRPGSVTMPAPMVLGRTAIYSDNNVRLDPPPVGARPSVLATTAWKQSRIRSPEGAYQLLLASYTSPYPSKNRPGDFSHVLAWVVIGRNVPLPRLPAIERPTRPGPGEQPTFGHPSPPCAFDFAFDAFDAQTGKELVLTQMVCRVSIGHQSTSVVIKLATGATATAKLGRYAMRFSIIAPPGPDGLGIQRNTEYGPTTLAFGKRTNIVGSGEGYFGPTASAISGGSTGGNGDIAYDCGA
jgi:hypothetical protein